MSYFKLLPPGWVIFGLLFALPYSFVQAQEVQPAPKYPVVFVHGWVGFDRILGITPYWFGITSELEKAGVMVYESQVSAVNSTEIRGEQLIIQIEQQLKRFSASKVNLIGHSQGGLTARYVAAMRPDLVASVTGVASPHKGSELADLIQKATGGDDTKRAKTLGWVVNVFGRLINLFTSGGFPQDGLASMKSLTTSGLVKFNKLYPQAVPDDCGEGDYEVNGIRYYSWGGVQKWTTIIDPSDLLLWFTGLAFEEANDGLVGRCSAHLGQVIRDDYPHNHLDEINQALGLDGFGEENEPIKIYMEHMSRLQAAGL